MKKSLFIALALLLMANLSNAQTIYRCNNDPSVTLSPNMFRTLQAAHDAATAGDIIYVEADYPSGATYGNLICTKTLKIFGNGYNHSQNTSIVQPFSQNPSSIGNVDIVSGTGSILSGLTINGTVKIKAQNTILTRCRVTSSSVELLRTNSGQNPNGATISHCHLYGGTYSITFQGYSTSVNDCANSNTTTYTAFQVSNITIKNNIMSGRIGQNGSTNLPTGTVACNITPGEVPNGNNFSITNNLSIGAFIQGCQNCTVHSNIFEMATTLGIFSNSNGSTASNNVCVGQPCIFGSNNVNLPNRTNLYVVSSPYILYDAEFQLSNISPAIGVGLGGVNAGAFGTNDPYRISGLAPIPQITSYSKNASSGVYTTTTPMTVTISVRGNN
jgi:hypothetical protein